ncbi:MAG TPA: response regulator [Pseudonocardia sp.]|nr:response regulator [Pseudonocardia sp.]
MPTTDRAAAASIISRELHDSLAHSITVISVQASVAAEALPAEPDAAGAALDRAEDIDVVGEAADGATALGVVRTTRPDVLLMDVRMPGMDGIEATRRIVADERLRAVAVVVLTTFDTDQNLFAAIRAGAVGFLLEDAPPDQLRAAVRAVAAGDALLPGGDPPGAGRRRHRTRRPGGRPGARADRPVRTERPAGAGGPAGCADGL